MSHVVQLLQLYNENQLFIEWYKILVEENCIAWLSSSKNSKGELADVVQVYNTARNIIPENNHEEPPVPRLRILSILVAQKAGIIIYPLLSRKLDYDRAPERFREKFRGLMTEGLWTVGGVIEDSLSEDPNVSCRNPFGFREGDLAFWWAAVVLIDWLKFRLGDETERYPTCVEFYSDPFIERRHKHWQDRALSSLNRIPMQFLYGDDFNNFMNTISSVSIDKKKFTPGHLSGQQHVDQRPPIFPFNFYGNIGLKKQ